MNYHIPYTEVENFLSMYWQLLAEVEAYANNDPYNKHLVESAYNLLHRNNILDKSIQPNWKKL